MQLSKLFRVTGIPALVLVDGDTSQLITRDGRAALASDPLGEHFPWQPRSLNSILSSTPLLLPPTPAAPQQLVPDPTAALAGRYIGFYFSAHYCPPCKRFTPQLARVYELVRERAPNFEIVLVSGDRDVAGFDAARALMPWLALPFAHRAITELEELFGVDGMPALVIVDPQGQFVTGRARGRVASDLGGEEFPWFPQPVEQLSAFSAERVNEAPCLILLTNGELDNIALAKTAMAPVAEDYFNGSDDQAAYFLVGCEDEMALKLRSFIGCGDRAPMLLLLDMSGSGGARWCCLKSMAKSKAMVTDEMCRAMMKAWEAGDKEQLLVWHSVTGAKAAAGENAAAGAAEAEKSSAVAASVNSQDEKENSPL